MLYPFIYQTIRGVTSQGRTLQQNMQELLQTQWLEPEELAQIQLDKLKNLLEHAYQHVPFYQQHFQKVGLHPHDIKSLADFQQIPSVTRQDIKSNPELFMATNFSPAELRVGLTGGSTGEPLQFYQTPASRLYNWAIVQRNRTWIGFKEGMKQAWLWGRDEDIPSFRRDQIWAKLRRQEWLSSYDMGADKMAEFAQTLLKFQPEFIFGYTSAVYLFAQYLDKQGITGIQPRVVQTAAEKLYDFQRELVEKVFACPVSEHYAALEVGTIADQCLHGQLHISAEAKYVEITKNGQPLPVGEEGEITITDLTNYAMPFIRYRGGDLGSLCDEKCSCGLGLPILCVLIGRTADFFKMPSGKLVSGLYWTLRMREVPGIRRFQTHQSAIDKIEVLYEVESGFDENLLEAKRQEILARLGEPIQLSFKQVDNIPLTRAGKHLFITSDVPVDFNDEALSEYRV